MHLFAFSGYNNGFHLSQSCSYIFVCLVQDANFSTTLELAVRFGKTLIIQEMDSVEAILYPIIRGDLISQGGNVKRINYSY